MTSSFHLIEAGIADIRAALRSGTVTSVQTGLCLTSGGTNNGAAVTVATCQGGTNQRWAKA